MAKGCKCEIRIYFLPVVAVTRAVFFFLTFFVQLWFCFQHTQTYWNQKNRYTNTQLFQAHSIKVCYLSTSFVSFFYFHKFLLSLFQDRDSLTIPNIFIEHLKLCSLPTPFETEEFHTKYFILKKMEDTTLTTSYREKIVSLLLQIFQGCYDMPL